MKTYLYLLISSVIISGLLIGLPVMAETTRTVDWYKTHSAERSAQLRECRNNPGELRDSPNCVNAARAADLVETSKKQLPVFKPMEGRELWPPGGPLKGGTRP